jgi:hypothetical protein
VQEFADATPATLGRWRSRRIDFIIHPEVSLQQDWTQDPAATPPDDVSPDGEDRIRDFFARHGGPGTAPRRGETSHAGHSGWYEVTAADGCCLRCEWSRSGGRHELKYSEISRR